MHSLIVNARDMGLSRGINKGIIQAYRQGIVSSASILVNFPAWEHAIRQATDFSGLGTGLQFNLTLGKPVSVPEQISTLVRPDGDFHGDMEMLAEAESDHIRTELCNQLGQFEKRKLKLTHIDGFDNVLALENILSIVLAVASRLRLPVCSYLPAQERYEYYRVPTVTAYVDSFYGKGANRPNLERLLGSCQESITEFRCRPGLVDVGLPNLTKYSWERERELAVLCAINKQQLTSRFRLRLADFNVVG